MEFRPENSYTRNYTKRYEDSARVADRCMTRYVKEYYQVRKRFNEFGNFKDAVLQQQVDTENKIQSSIVDHLYELYNAHTMDNYPFESGFYNDTIVRAMKQQTIQKAAASYEPVFDSQMKAYYASLT